MHNIHRAKSFLKIWMSLRQIYRTVQSGTTESLKLLFWDRKFYYHVENNRPMVFLLTKINSVHMFPQDFYKISLNAVLSCTPESSKISPSFTFPDEMSVQILKLSHASCLPLLSHPPWLDHRSNMSALEEHKLWSSFLSNFQQSRIAFALPGPTTLLRNLFSNTRNLFDFHNTLKHRVRLNGI
jgi:hypothetical protein